VQPVEHGRPPNPDRAGYHETRSEVRRALYRRRLMHSCCPPAARRTGTP
jgi:hypothetical protein